MISKSTAPDRRVVVTGVAVMCALGTDTEEVWRAVRAGDCGVRPTRRIDVSTLTCQYSAELERVPQPPGGPRDRASAMALHVGTAVVDAAGLSLDSLDPYRLGLAVGTSVGGLDAGEQYHAELIHHGRRKADPARLLSYPLHTAADELSVAIGARGPKVVISNACAAGANAIGYAADTLRLDRADVMLAGGVDPIDILSVAGFDSLRALDRRPCAPYSRSSGLSLGEGAAFLVLETESHAAARGAPILGYVLAYALTSDAHHATAPDPGGSGARRAMEGALSEAGLTAGDVDYVNGHGTGTPANDSAELRAFGSLFPDPARPPVTSTKSQVGHTLGAAGAVEAAVCVLALRDQVLPPTVNVAAGGVPGRDIVPNRSRPQPVDVVLSNSFAFGGNNCSVLIGRRPGPARLPEPRRVVLTGAGVVSPLGVGRAEFLQALRAGTVAIGPARWPDDGDGRARLAAELPDDRHRRLVDRAYARRLDQLGLLTLAATRLALQDAAFTITRAKSERVGMVFGTGTGPMETVTALSDTIIKEGPHKVNPRLFPNSVMNAAAGHACLAFQIRGPLSTVSNGCTSGLTALGYAADLIRQGRADVMLAVGADELTPHLHLGYAELGLLTGTRVQPYDRARSGMALGTGAVAFVLESAEHAAARGATPLAELLGHAITSDAYRVAGNEPSGAAIAECMTRALTDADIPAGRVGGVYGDARGVRSIDLAEAIAIRKALPAVPVACLSGQTGHLNGSTPLLSVVSAMESCATSWLPPIQGLTDPLPPLAGGRDARPPGTEQDAYLVNAANWGGTYATAVLARWEA